MEIFEKILTSGELGVEADVEFGGGDGDEVIAAFGASDAATDVRNAGDAEDFLFDSVAEGVHGIEGRAGLSGGGDDGGVFEEIREKFTMETGGEEEGRGDGEEGGKKDGAWEAECKMRENFCLEGFEGADDEWIAVFGGR